jgi:hypothetical protein
MNARRWKAAYRAAILEPNRYTIPQRVSEAEEEILARTLELSRHNGAEVEIERDALEQAVSSLRALRYAAENSYEPGVKPASSAHHTSTYEDNEIVRRLGRR